MGRRLAALVLLSLWGMMAPGLASVYTFPYQSPPAALCDTVMAVVEGTTEIRLTFAGDCTLGGESNGGGKRFTKAVEASGYAYPFAQLRALLASDDLTLANLEGVLSDRKLRKAQKTYNFRGASAYTAILTQGAVECVTLANNHILDYGVSGRQDTVAALDAAGLHYVDDTYVCVLEKDGVRVGFTASGFQLNRTQFMRQADALRALGCAAIVHVMHTGVEYAVALSRTQVQTASFLAEQGVVLVVGHHPHVAQGLWRIGDTQVAYSLGNCVFGGNADPADYDAYLLGVNLCFAEGRLQSTQTTLWPIRVSSTPDSNDYQPYLLAGDDAARVLEKIQATSGFELAPFLAGQGAVQDAVATR